MFGLRPLWLLTFCRIVFFIGHRYLVDTWKIRENELWNFLTLEVQFWKVSSVVFSKICLPRKVNFFNIFSLSEFSKNYNCIVKRNFIQKVAVKILLAHTNQFFSCCKKKYLRSLQKFNNPKLWLPIVISLQFFSPQ